MSRHIVGSEAAIREKSLGDGGSRMTRPGDFEMGSKLMMSLKLPNEEHSVPVMVRVAWAGENNQVGFEFVALPKDISDKIEALVWEEVDPADLW